MPTEDMSETFPTYPELKPIRFDIMLGQLLDSIERDPNYKLEKLRASIRESIAALPKCEYVETAQCSCAAQCVSHGMITCLDHGKLRHEYFKD